MSLKSEQKSELVSGNQAFPVLVVVVFLLIGLLLRNLIASRVVSNIGNIRLAKTLEIRVIDFRSYPNCQISDQYIDLDSQFSRAVALDPQNQAAWQHLVKVRWAAGDCAGVEQLLASGAIREDQFIELIQALLDIQAERFQGWENYPHAAEIGKLLAQAGKEADEAGLMDESVRWYESAFLFDPTINTADWLAIYYTAKSDTQRISWLWDYMAQEKAGTDDGWWAKFHQANLAGDLDREIRMLRQGAETSSDPYLFLFELGHAYRRAKAYENAIESFEAARKLRPNEIAPVIYIGDIYRELKDYENAERLFEIAHSMDENNHLIYYYMSVTNYEVGNLDAAINELKTGIEIQVQKNLKPWEWSRLLGSWYEEDSQCAEAKGAFELALEWQPGEASLLEEIKNLAFCSK